MGITKKDAALHAIGHYAPEIERGLAAEVPNWPAIDKMLLSVRFAIAILQSDVPPPSGNADDVMEYLRLAKALADETAGPVPEKRV